MSVAFPFLRLPLELREQIYSLYFRAADRLVVSPGNGGGKYLFEFKLYRVCKQVYFEAQTVFRRQNAFVRIQTPWAQSAQHISSDGLVPLVAYGPSGDLFTHHHALIQISMPLFHATHTIILLLPDLVLFTKFWYYASLTHMDMNQNLCLSFELRDPYYSADPKPVPKAIQKAVLLPFGDVKGLHDIEFEGGWDEKIIAELKRTMAVPYTSMDKCLENAAVIMDEADHLLATGKPQEALDAFVRASSAIHILVDGRSRRIMAQDGFFRGTVPSGRFAHQEGETVRVIMRICLVSRTMLSYLKLNQPTEAAFWGMRSIRIVKDNMGTEMEAFLGSLPGWVDMGFIWARTAIALELMERVAGGPKDEGGKMLSELDGYKIWDGVEVEALWKSAAKHFKGTGKEADKKKIIAEAKEFGVKAPEVFQLKEGNEVDSMSHLDLGAIDS